MLIDVQIIMGEYREPLSYQQNILSYAHIPIASALNTSHYQPVASASHSMSPRSL